MSTLVAPRQLITPRQMVRPQPVRSVYGKTLAWFWMLPLLYYAVHGNIPSFRGAGSGDSGDYITSTSNSGGVDGRIYIVAYAMLALVVILPFAKRLLSFMAEDKTQWLLPTLAVLSSYWSQYPSTTLTRSVVGLALMTMVACCFVRQFNPEQQMQMITLLALVVAFLSFFFAAFFPGQGVAGGGHFGALQGIFAQKNSAARTMIFLLPAIACLRPRDSVGRMFRSVAMFCTLAVIALTLSRTGWILAFLCLANLRALRMFGKFRRRDASFVMGFGIMVLAGVVAVLATSWRDILLALGKDPTLTGRTTLWSAVMESIAKRPLLGWGYSGFWSGLRGESLYIVLKTHWAVPYAHDGFLDVWLSVGLVGLVVLGFVYLKAWRDAITCFLPARHRAVDWYISILMLTLFYNLDEGTFMAPFEISWFLFIVAALGLGIHARELRAQRKRTQIADNAREFAQAR